MKEQLSRHYYNADDLRRWIGEYEAKYGMATAEVLVAHRAETLIGIPGFHRHVWLSFYRELQDVEKGRPRLLAAPVFRGNPGQPNGVSPEGNDGGAGAALPRKRRWKLPRKRRWKLLGCRLFGHHWIQSDLDRQVEMCLRCSLLRRSVGKRPSKRWPAVKPVSKHGAKRTT